MKYRSIAGIFLLVSLLLGGCKKEEEELLPFMEGELRVIFPSFVVAGSQIDGFADGIEKPVDAEYFWICDEEPKLFQDTVHGKEIHIQAPAEVGNYEVRCQVLRDGYYGKQQILDLMLIYPEFNGGSLSGVERGTDSIIDMRDNQRYYIERIGQLDWFSENLNYKGTSARTYGAAYNNSEAITDFFGRLYTWKEATGGEAATGLGSGPQGICPDGWTVPTREDWEDLGKTLNGGEALSFDDMWMGMAEKVTPDAYINDVKMWPYSPNFDKKYNQFKWNAFPSGNSVDSHSRFQNIFNYGMWWSSSVLSADMACYRYIYQDQNYFAPGFGDRDEFGISVRCVRKF